MKTLTALVIGVVLVAAMMNAAMTVPQASGSPGVPTPSPEAVRDIPPVALAFYQQAGEQYGIRWAVLAAIGKIETDHCRSTAPGVHSGTNSAGAAGCMQFLLSTWRLPGVGNGGNPYDLHDAIFAAARYLVKGGAPGDYRKAIFSYNHADWYVAEVMAQAAKYEAAPTAPAPGGNGGSCDLHRATLVRSPRSYSTLPAWAMANGRTPEQVDSRILPDVLCVLRTYGLRVNAARESGHHTHGDGTALDMRPASGDDQQAWDSSALRLAHDLGWTEQCAAAGVSPVCPLVPAIHGVFYNGYEGHGDPAHVGGNAHIHVSWFASSWGNSGLVAPNAWVMAFPAG